LQTGSRDFLTRGHRTVLFAEKKGISRLFEVSNMRKSLIVGLLLTVLSATSVAADFPKAEIFGGYQFTHLDGGPNANGFNFALNGNFNNWFGITADLSATYGSIGPVSVSNYTYTFGPVVSARQNKGYTPFVHALFGGDHASAGFLGSSASANGFATMLGGGLDVNVNDRVAVRAGQFDWFLVHGSGGTSKGNVRLSFGVVFRFK
jgi:hypothetical protein